MKRGLQQIGAVSETAERGIALLAEEAAHLPRRVTMVYGQSLAVLGSLANGAHAALSLPDLVVLFKGEFEPPTKPFPSMFKRVRLATLPSKSVGFFHALLALAAQPSLSGCVKIELAVRLNLVAGRAILFGYNVFSHGVNLSHRFRCGVARVMLPTSSEPSFIIPQFNPNKGANSFITEALCLT